MCPSPQPFRPAGHRRCMGSRATQVGWGALAGLCAVVAVQGGHQPDAVTIATRPAVSILPTTNSTVPEPSPDLPAMPPDPASPTTILDVTPTVWDRLAACTLDPGQGRLHWTPTIWARHRGEAPTDVRDATWDQEQAAAERLLTETSGRYTAWPLCAQRLGLPR